VESQRFRTTLARLSPFAANAIAAADLAIAATAGPTNVASDHPTIQFGGAELRAWLRGCLKQERYGPQQEATAVSFERITIDAEQMGGVPCIRGMRIPVATVVGMFADEMSRAQILDALPDLEADDVTEALRYAAAAVQERELPLRPTA